MYNKNKAGYIGFYRVNNPWNCGGIWPLNQVAIEASDYSWAEQYLWKHNGTLTGWTNNGVTVNAGSGNPAPSLSVTATKYAYYAPLTGSYLYKTIEWDVYITAGMVNLHFACDNTGKGPMLRLDTRAGKYCGLMWANSWTSYTGEPKAAPNQVTLATNTWHKIRVDINKAARAEWFIDYDRKDSAPVLLTGNNIAVNGDTAGAALFDNLIIHEGCR